MARLTTFSKILITAITVGAIFIGGKLLVDQGIIGGKTTNNNGNSGNSGNNGNSGNSGNTGDVIKIGVVTWGGYAGGEYFNEGFAANTASRFYKDYGFQVEFKVLDDFEASRNAFKADEVHLLWCTIDALPTEIEGLGEHDPQVVFQADWSRGGDAIVVRRGINSVKDLRGKKIAVAPMTPSHTFLIWLLDAGNMTQNDIELVEVPSAIDAAQAFKSGNVDAAVVWSPDDADCVDQVPGARVLQNTKNASHIIADVFIAKKNYINNNKSRLIDLYEGWMKGAAEINASDANRQKAAKILADGLGMPEDFCYDAIGNVRLTTHGDNLNFYKINRDYSGVTGEDLYSKMAKTYNQLGYAPANVKNWRQTANMDIVKGADSRLNGASGQEAEGAKAFTKVTEDIKNKEAIASKKISINFASGSSTLSENAKTIIDIQLVDIAKMFSNARIRIEGNTDKKGARATNIKLSEQRAQAVADYLESQYNMPRDRFIIIGNGPDKPVEGCENSSSKECNDKNRRTEFQLIAD